MKLYEWHKSTEKPDESCECLILFYNDRIFVGEFSTTPHFVFTRYFMEPEFYYNNEPISPKNIKAWLAFKRPEKDPFDKILDEYH
ncbi:MAG: hypothetical protein VB076_05215 [Synergistaceae bacterium]|nr:hypothetical protein [Synergistaceae bacterium]